MKVKSAEGRRIVKIHQTRCVNRNTGKPIYHVDGIELDNGTMLTFGVHETEGDYLITATANKQERGKA